MSHHIYVTEGFVVSSQPHGEAGKFIMVFTRELGMVGAVAQGLRYQKSKLRYHLQDYAHVELSLVRGKDIWRVTGAKAVEVVETAEGSANSDHDHSGLSVPTVNMAEAYMCYVRILALLKRLIPGEEKNAKLFDLVRNAFELLAKIGASIVADGQDDVGDFVDASKLHLQNTKFGVPTLECVTVQGILHELGYVRPHGATAEFCEIAEGGWTTDMLARAEAVRPLLLKEINTTLKATQL